jgi:hypothetical protein
MDNKDLPENSDDNLPLSQDESLTQGANDQELFSSSLQRLINGLDLTKEKYKSTIETSKSQKSKFIAGELVSRIDTMTSISFRLKGRIDNAILYYVKSEIEIPEDERPSHDEFAEKLKVFNAPSVIYPIVTDLAKGLIEGFEYAYSKGVEDPLNIKKEDLSIENQENSFLLELIDSLQLYYPAFEKLLEQFDIQLADSESKFSAFDDWINELFRNE